MDLRVVIAPGVDAPRFLVEQKESWNPEIVYLWMAQATGVWSLMIFDGDKPEPCALAIAIRNDMYRALVVDTLIIDRQYRKDLRVVDVVKLLAPLCQQIARECGLPRITFATEHPRAMKRLIPALRKLEVVMELEA